MVKTSSLRSENSEFKTSDNLIKTWSEGLDGINHPNEFEEDGVDVITLIQSDPLLIL